MITQSYCYRPRWIGHNPAGHKGAIPFLFHFVPLSDRGWTTGRVSGNVKGTNPIFIIVGKGSLGSLAGIRSGFTPQLGSWEVNALVIAMTQPISSPTTTIPVHHIFLRLEVGSTSSSHQSRMRGRARRADDCCSFSKGLNASLFWADE